MLEGAPKHYMERKVVLHTDKESGRIWIQLEGEPINPYGRGESEIIAWPETAPSEGSPSDEAAKSAKLDEKNGK